MIRVKWNILFFIFVYKKKRGGIVLSKSRLCLCASMKCLIIALYFPYWLLIYLHFYFSLSFGWCFFETMISLIKKEKKDTFLQKYSKKTERSSKDNWFNFTLGIIQTFSIRLHKKIALFDSSLDFTMFRTNTLRSLHRLSAHPYKVPQWGMPLFHN